MEAGFISEAVRFVFFLCEDLVVLMKFWVIMYDGASILGGETVIGEHSVVGGNAFLTGSVADNTRVVISAPETVFKNAH